MAEKLKGITLMINGDATGLDEALKGVNAQAKNTQQELRNIDKALKLDPSSTELLEQKQRALRDAVTETTKKLKTLEDAQQKMVDAGITDKNRAQYEALSREILKTRDELAKAKTAADNFSVGLEQAKVAADKVASAAQTIADKTKGLSVAAAGLLTAIGGAAYKSAQAADELNTLSKQTGISTQDLQKMAYASDIVDVSVETIAGSMTKLRKSMKSSTGTETFEKLGIAVTDVNGELRDSTEVFYETIAALGNIENETERDIVAMDLFGRSADQLAGIIDDGGESLKALGQEAEDLGIILDQDTLDSLNAVNDSIDKLKAKATGEIAKAGATAMEALAPILDTIVEKISTLLEWIGSLDEQQLQTIITVAAVVAAISPIAGIIATISGAISTFLTLWPQIKAAGLAIKAFAAANPILLVMTAVAAAAALIYTHWDQIKPILEKLWEKCKEIFGKVAEKITAVADTIKSAFETVKNTLTGIWEGITNTIKDKINAIIGFINGLIDKINGFLEIVNSSSIVQGIAGIFGMKLGTLQNIPLLANGGSISEGSAIVGEAGPEVLTMNNGRADVTPIAQTTNTYNTINQTSRQPVLVDLVLDGVTLAQALYDPLRQVGALHGPQLAR